MKLELEHGPGKKLLYLYFIKFYRSYRQSTELSLALSIGFCSINRQGGCGRIIKVHQDSCGKVTSIDVKYLLHNGRDLNVDVAFVQPANLQPVGRTKRTTETSKQIIPIADIENKKNSKTLSNKKKKLSETPTEKSSGHQGCLQIKIVPHEPLPKKTGKTALGTQPTKKGLTADNKTKIADSKLKSKKQGISSEFPPECKRKIGVDYKGEPKMRAKTETNIRQRSKVMKQSNSSKIKKIDPVPIEILASSIDTMICSPLTGASDVMVGSIRGFKNSSPPFRHATLATTSMSVLTIDDDSPVKQKMPKLTESMRRSQCKQSDDKAQLKIAKKEAGRSRLTSRELNEGDRLEAGAFIEQVTRTTTVNDTRQESKLATFSFFLQEIFTNEDAFEEKDLFLEMTKISTITRKPISFNDSDIAGFLKTLETRNRIMCRDGKVYRV